MESTEVQTQKDVHPANFFNLEQYQHRKLFEGIGNVWDALNNLSKYLQQFKPQSLPNKARTLGNAFIDPESLVVLGQGTVVEHGAMIKGPAIIGKNCQIRGGAYIRGGIVTGDRCVIGHSTEVKGSILMNDVQIPHFNYIGDSILGNGSHLGAGVIVSNLRLDWKNIKIEFEGSLRETNRQKLGAIVGDHSQVGCNSVLNPGSIIGKKCIIYPGVQFKGTIGNSKIVKLKQEYQVVDRL